MTWDLNQLEALFSDNQDLVVTREEIIVESLLFSVNEVKDKTALNEEILKTHMIFPLTTVGISNVAGDDYYTAFGSLSSQSKAQSITIEVQTLFQNVEAFLDAYAEHLL